MGFNFILAATALVSLLLSPATAAVREAEPAQGSDAQRVAALVDYIGADYPAAVKDGRVVNEGEYAEQLRFAADARALARGLLGPAVEDDPLLSALAEVESLVAARAHPTAIARACRSAREQVVLRFRLRTMPASRPELEPARELFARSCASCHGAAGEGDTERARTLDPPPARFRDPDRLAGLSPYRVFNALTFGVPGTAMAAFDSLSPADRWSLAFFVMRLGHEGEATRGPVAMSLADMAEETDAELKEDLRSAGHPDPAAGVAWVRCYAAFAVLPTGVEIDRVRGLASRAVRARLEGRRADADRLLLDAYLQGFEPLEPRLAARDPVATREVESAFHALRAAMVGDEVAVVRAGADVLDRRLAALGGGGRVAPFAAAFLIYLREGIEAALLVAALAAGLVRLGRPDAVRYVHLGWLLALPAGVLTWWLLDRVLALGAERRELLEALVGLFAAAVLFAVSFWMISKVESRRWIAWLRLRLEAGLGRGSLLALSGLAFLAVYREAAETVLFTQALLLDAEGRRGAVGAGAAAGLGTVVAAALVLGRSLRRLPIGPFFALSGLFLCGLAAAFAGSAVFELVAAGYLPPRPVTVPSVTWLGIHPDLNALAVQTGILLVIAVAGVAALRTRTPAPPRAVAAPDPPRG